MNHLLDLAGELAPRLPVGFIWDVTHRAADGRVKSIERVHNLVPTEGLNHILSIVLKAGTQVPSWYIGIFEGNYTPVLTVTAATWVAAATECSAYVSATRPAWTGGSVSAGAVSNTASKASFVMNADKTIYGATLVSVSTKASGSGVLLSAVKFPTAKVLASGDTLEIAAGVTLVNPS